MAWSFLRVYFDQIDAWKALGDSERGRLLMAALEYAASEKAPEFKGNERYQWPQIRAQIDREKEAYLGKVKQCSEAGKASSEARRNQRPLTPVNENQRPLIEEQEQDQNITAHSEEKKAKEKKADAFETFAGENADLLNALREFESMRAKIKKPLTAEAKKRLTGKLALFTEDTWIPMLNQSVDHCWQDIYPLKDEKPQQRPKKYKTAAEYTPPQAINTSQLDKIRAAFGV